MNFKPKSIYSIFLSVLLITACSQSEGKIANSKDSISKEDCSRILSNLKALNVEPELFEYSEVADADYLVTNLGEETRKKIEKEIVFKFPFLDQTVAVPEDNPTFYRTNISNLAAFGLEMALVGTKFESPFSKTQIVDSLATDNFYDQSLEPFTRELFGEVAGEYEKSGCASYDADYETRSEWNRARDFIWRFTEYLYVIRSCEKFGKYSQNECAKNDYVSTPEDWTPIPVDPWTRDWSDDVQEGLAKFSWCWNQGLEYDNFLDSCE
jgi:hypothetical protein